MGVGIDTVYRYMAIYSSIYDVYAYEFVCADDQSEHITHRWGKQASVAGKAIDSPFPY